MMKLKNKANMPSAQQGKVSPTRAMLSIGGLANDHITADRTPYAPTGLVVRSGNPIRVAAAGQFVVQDEASQLVAAVVAAQPGEHVLDLCAAPGGKTTAIAAQMNDEGLVIATDVRTRRIGLLANTVRESGAKHTRVVQIGQTGALPFEPVFDRVLVDAPCSGLGTIRRDPDIRWRRTAADLPPLAQAQLALLERAAEVVGPRGRLVYATCSSEPEENEHVVDTFLAAHSGFEIVDLREEPLLSPAIHQLIDQRGMLRTTPFAHRLEAFFAAVLRRRFMVRLGS